MIVNSSGQIAPVSVHDHETQRGWGEGELGVPLYYDLIAAFERETGIPVLVNTSFNVHEEPIVNTPRKRQALLDKRIDFVVTQQAIYEAA